MNSCRDVLDTDIVAVAVAVAVAVGGIVILRSSSLKLSQDVSERPLIAYICVIMFN